MTLKTVVLAGVTALSLAAPAAALAQPYWDQDRGYHDDRGYRDRDDWRRHEWREREAWEHRGYGWGYGQRCFIERRGHYDWRGYYVSRPVRICR
jgi:Ni/Co efflux regulator RcnB